MTAPLTPLGALVEARREHLGLSKRQAARIAGISEGRWRQVVSGVQRAGGVAIPVNPRAETVAAMAHAVGVGVPEALAAAGLPAELAERLADVDPTLAEVEASNLSDETKRRIVAMLRAGL